MPLYEYYCTSCQNKFSIFLSMTEECHNCKMCDSEDVIKVVSSISNKIDKSKYRSKVGDLVNTHIEDARQEIKKEKKKMMGDIDI